MLPKALFTKELVLKLLNKTLELRGSISTFSMLLELYSFNPNFPIFSGVMLFYIQFSSLIESPLPSFNIGHLIRSYMTLYLIFIPLRFLVVFVMLLHFKLIEQNYNLELESVFS
jgi:hypothetical protein